MKARRLFILALALIAALSTVPFAANAATGTALSSAAELTALMNDSSKWSGEYYLAADIDLSLMSNQAPIGNIDVNFTGTFDGNGKKISGLAVSGSKYQGLFGFVHNATIKNLTVEGTVTDLTMAGGAVYTGGIVGCVTGTSTLDGLVSRVDVDAILDGGTQGVGGIAGWLGCISADKITVNNCHSYGKTEAGRVVGNLIGVLSVDGVAATAGAVGGSVSVTNCTANGEVYYSSATAYGQAGGLIGCIYTRAGADFNVLIDNCTNNADCTGLTYKQRVGGIVGWINGETATILNEKGGVITISNSVNNGDIYCTASGAGIIAFTSLYSRSDFYVNIENCVNRGEIISDGNNIGGILGYFTGGDFTVKGCANYGAINSSGSNVGGILGGTLKASKSAVSKISIQDCANYADLSAYDEAGGIAGFSNDTIIIKNCFNGGKELTTNLVGVSGAIVASVPNLTVENNFYTEGGADTSGKKLTSAEAALSSSYTGWNFSSTWVIENGLPVLKYLASATGTTTPAQTTAAQTTTVQTTTAQATTAPSSAETTASSTGESSAETSDLMIIFSAAVLVAVAAYIIIAKRKSFN